MCSSINYFEFVDKHTQRHNNIWRKGGPEQICTSKIVDFRRGIKSQNTYPPLAKICTGLDKVCCWSKGYMAHNNLGVLFWKACTTWELWPASCKSTNAYMKVHIFELQIMIWRYDWSSQLHTTYLSSCEIKAWKKFRPERDSDLWPLNWCSALPTELSSQLVEHCLSSHNVPSSQLAIYI